ncbi:acyl-CoA dehydrogenase C-terminal domain-containing protein [Chromobacterium haemolyticum]|uniref:Acyl-CoA dehydrogenase C-terminal domain-containing protein n=1 Tax=Chromobacterium haemolyticum TaxID=394935 RepID=A0ABS3GIA8_9NEIS|nr:acyl-CoA dehydrogenase C-terminal domain-containing protein [Chromobacterium haemolyticum]MBK0413674.1 acyl-CoA dehydrogenase C-terminal domain-containing protein [Chromobacterium haemolyticum]MBO0414776.1 acyl-CoA dehydrogenase C-terminal domain-containing protein [Chromobacterium haemolyticum]MBO0498037.1 acyl-CoA dehydrogenase C-terminal domain-containing protein [Chromobacterium haemolyticum]MDH0342465.1 acyl-CoA dehydrogenase C-terminal domain-containing protein [Chromobacterium haemoly
MPAYQAPLRDFDFVLHELIKVQDIIPTLPGYEEATQDIFRSYLEAAAQFCESELAPLNRQGDEEGCHYDSSTKSVTTPPGFKEAYQQYCELGFPTLDCDPAYGGQGMPKALSFPIMEMQCSSNVAWSMYPGLSHGAYSAIHAHGTEAQKAAYLPKLVDGSWTGTMCLTEPHCGTDLGLLKTRAEPNGDGSYSITGTKIFISAGEHDMSDNIIHLVLARLPDSPKDVKGISLFIVPKFHDDGSRNAVACGSLEHKMGIKANATAVINLDGAKGYLIGEVNKGLSCMFTMMNAARLGCGMQGLGIGEASFQGALAYARERLQMRSLTGDKCPDKPADPIIVHPDVRRMLLTQKAYTEAGRALTTLLALQLDIEDKHPDADARQDAADLVALLTPVAKAFMTDNGYEAANLGMQVFGGHGYIREWGMEQLVRDCRISQIYEGTNGIQAIDLLGRKVLMDQGQKLRKFTKQIHKFCQANEGNDKLADYVAPLSKLLKDVGEVTMGIGMAGMQNRDEAGAAATDYLRLIGHLSYAWLWAQMAEVAHSKLGGGEDGFYQAKILTGRFYMTKLFPEVHSLLAKLKAGAKPLMELQDEHFAF